MRAIVYKRYGPPEVARLTEVPVPVPGYHVISVKVFASTVEQNTGNNLQNRR
jgi:NADPH:quinone reductase-like Zn-dependent oxidoreductase